MQLAEGIQAFLVSYAHDPEPQFPIVSPDLSRSGGRNITTGRYAAGRPQLWNTGRKWSLFASHLVTPIARSLMIVFDVVPRYAVL